MFVFHYKYILYTISMFGTDKEFKTAMQQAQKEINALERNTKKITAKYRRVTEFLGPTATRSSNSNTNNSNRSNSTKINIILKKLERNVENNNKKSSNENDAMFEMIYNRRVNSNANAKTFDMVDEMLNNTMRKHRAGAISTNQMQKNLAEYMNHIGHRYRHSNRGLALERKIRWFMGSKKIR